MNNNYLVHIIRFFFFVFFQVLILNNVLFSGYINPYLYVMFILLLPFEINRLILLIIAFVTGLSVDYLTHTPGMHAAACVLMAYARPYVVKAIYSKDEYEQNVSPTIAFFGFSWILSYTTILVFIHHFLLFLIENGTFQGIWTSILRIIFSTVFSVFLIMLSHYIFFKTKK